MNVYMVRHQAGGFLPEFIFAQEPTEEQLAPIRRLMAYRHGHEHPTLGGSLWLRVYKMDVINGAAVPFAPLPGERQGPDGGEPQPFTISGTGIVG